VYHLAECSIVSQISANNRRSGHQPPAGKRLHTGCTQTMMEVRPILKGHSGRDGLLARLLRSNFKCREHRLFCCRVPAAPRWRKDCAMLSWRNQLLNDQTTDRPRSRIVARRLSVSERTKCAAGGLFPQPAHFGTCRRRRSYQQQRRLTLGSSPAPKTLRDHDVVTEQRTLMRRVGAVAERQVI